VTMDAVSRKLLEEVGQETEQLRAHVADTQQLLQYNRHLRRQAFEHIEQARVHLQQTRELLEEAQSDPDIEPLDDLNDDPEQPPYLP